MQPGGEGVRGVGRTQGGPEAVRPRCRCRPIPEPHLLLGSGVLVGGKQPWQRRGGDTGVGPARAPGRHQAGSLSLGSGSVSLQPVLCVGWLPVFLGLSPAPSLGILYPSKLNKHLALF